MTDTRQCSRTVQRKVTEVVLADGFVAYRTDQPTDNRAAERIRNILARHPDAKTREVPG